MPRWSRSQTGTIYTPDPVVRENPLNRGLIGWWLPLPSNSGGSTLYDLLNLSPASLAGGAKWASQTRPNGFAAINYPTNGSATLTDPSGRFSAIGKTSFSFAFWWFQSTVGVAASYPIGSNAATGNYKWFIKITGSQFVFQRTNSAGQDALAINSLVTAATWTHFALTYDGTTMAVFKNGLSAGSIAGSTTIGAWSTPGSVFLGACASDVSNTYSDDIRYWNRGLSATDVAAVYQDSLTGYAETIRRVRPAQHVLRVPAVPGNRARGALQPSGSTATQTVSAAAASASATVTQP